MLSVCETRERFKCVSSSGGAGCVLPRQLTRRRARRARMTQMFDFAKHGCPSRQGSVRRACLPLLCLPQQRGMLTAAC